MQWLAKAAAKKRLQLNNESWRRKYSAVEAAKLMRRGASG